MQVEAMTDKVMFVATSLLEAVSEAVEDRDRHDILARIALTETPRLPCTRCRRKFAPAWFLLARGCPRNP